MPLLMPSACLLFLSLLLRATLVPSSAKERVSLALFFSLYCDLALYLYLWIRAPREIQFAGAVLFGLGSVFFICEVLHFWIKKTHLHSAHLKIFKKFRKGPYQEIVAACQMLSDAGMGALMILERKKTLAPWCQKGIQVDAKITRELIFSVFTPPGALHDGAVIFQKDRLAACAVIVPLSSSSKLSKDLGTRHRAAVGFSEITDGLCIVVSEETGGFSIADRGVLTYDIPLSLLPETLERALRFKRPRKKNHPPVRQPAGV